MKPSLASIADFLGMDPADLAATYDEPSPGSTLRPGDWSQQQQKQQANRAERAALAAAADEAHTSVASLLLARRTAQVEPFTDLGDAAPYVVPEHAGGFLVAEPPPANRGVGLTTHPETPRKSYNKLDWLAGTFPAANLGDVAELVSTFLGTATPSCGIHSYREGVAWPSAARLCWSDRRPEAFLSLNGDSVDLIPPDRLARFVVSLDAHGFRASRLDAAFTDCDRIASMDEVHAAAERQDFTQFLVTDSHRPRKRGVLIGDSRDFGRRGKLGSGAFFQAYDKLLDCRAKGEPDIDAIRYEARFSDKKARAAWVELLDAARTGDLAPTLGRLVGGAIDFKRRGDETHLDRMDRLPWWDKVVAVLGRVELDVDRFTPDLPRTIYHLGKQYLGTFARILAAYRAKGLDALDHLDAAVDAWLADNAHRPLTELDLRFHPAEVWFHLQDTDHSPQPPGGTPCAG